jgi:hypothetical protein
MLLPSDRLSEWKVFERLTELGYRAYTYDESGHTTAVTELTVSGYRNILFEMAE